MAEGQVFETGNESPPPARFAVWTTYVIPALEELKRRFPPYVNPGYKSVVFRSITVCEEVARHDRRVAFEYVHLDRRVSEDEVLAEMTRRGLRPALPEELLAFAEQYPNEQLLFPIVALGAEAELYGSRHVAYLWSGVYGRDLSLRRLDGCCWYDSYRFLAVPLEITG